MGPYPGQRGVRHTRVGEAMSAINSITGKFPGSRADAVPDGPVSGTVKVSSLKLTVGIEGRVQFLSLLLQAW